MFSIQKHLRHGVLAIGLLAASLTANAGVLSTYRVSVADTSNIGAIDFYFTNNVNSPVVTASLTHFTGTPLLEADVVAPVTETANGYDFSNNFAYLIAGVAGPFTFDLNFSGFLGVAAPSSDSDFSIGLYDLNGDYIGVDPSSLDFTLTNTGVTVTKYSSLLDVSVIPAAAAVPEPADWLLMLTGLGFVVGMTRMNGRSTARRLAVA